MTFLGVPPALDWPVQFCAFSTAVAYVVSLITNNVSQVDRVWTFLPTIYTAYFALLPLFPYEQSFPLVPYAPKALGWKTLSTFSPRALLMLSLIVIWMFRLSYNTYRRGLFNLHDEDYRWAVLRKRVPTWLFHITNLTFIAGIQNVLLLLLGLPAYYAFTLQPHTPLETSDFALAALALVILGFEFTADNQQYSYHAYKHAFLAKKEDKAVKPYNAKEQWPGARLAWTPDDARRGFVTRGLWRYSRHPNFACEQSFWWIITLFPLLASSPPNLPLLSDFPPLKTTITSITTPSLFIPYIKTLNAIVSPSVQFLLPSICLSILFVSSTIFTESITCEKYPKVYPAYQERVGMFDFVTTGLKWLKTRFVGAKRREEIHQNVWGNVREIKPKSG